MEELLAEALRDPVLGDVRADAELHELQLLVAKETEKDVVTLRLVLADATAIEMEALPTWTVSQLKRSIERRIVSRALIAAGRRRSISWKKHWKQYVLVHEDTELDAGRQHLQQLLDTASKGPHVLRFERRRRRGTTPESTHTNRPKGR